MGSATPDISKGNIVRNGKLSFSSAGYQASHRILFFNTLIKLRCYPKISIWIVMASFIILLNNCSNDKASEPISSLNTTGFTFFDLGADSLLSSQIRKHLENRLGSEAISHRTTIDLSIHSPGFLETYFPHLNQINKKLNWPPRDRVEHNITKLMYRYVNAKNLPFKYVELFFSNYNGEPLFFRIHAGSDGAPMIDTLKRKYGSSQQIIWSQNKGETLYWKDKKDILTASSAKDRYGRSEYLFCIFYTANLEKVIEKEKIEQKAKEEKIQNAGDTAF